jgi:hypothetical protein
VDLEAERATVAGVGVPDLGADLGAPLRAVVLGAVDVLEADLPGRAVVLLAGAVCLGAGRPTFRTPYTGCGVLYDHAAGGTYPNT